LLELNREIKAPTVGQAEVHVPAFPKSAAANEKPLARQQLGLVDAVNISTQRDGSSLEGDCGFRTVAGCGGNFEKELRKLMGRLWLLSHAHVTRPSWTSCQGSRSPSIIGSNPPLPA
jgi:hypothetical protein